MYRTQAAGGKYHSPRSREEREPSLLSAQSKQMLCPKLRLRSMSIFEKSIFKMITDFTMKMVLEGSRHNQTESWQTRILILLESKLISEGELIDKPTRNNQSAALHDFTCTQVPRSGTAQWLPELTYK